MTDQVPKGLYTPLYGLYYVDPVSYQGPTSAELAALVKDYTPAQIREFYAALTWSLEHPDHPFNKILPRMPHDNKAILKYFEKLRDGIRPVVEKLPPAPTP